MKSVKSIGSVKGKKVLVRADFNVPVKDGKVLDTTRILAVLPTIKLLLKKGAKVILVSHIGREEDATLKPVYTFLRKQVSLRFVPHIVGKEVEDAIDRLLPGEVILLENVRSHSGEKLGDKSFAKTLASYADYFVNEAFPVCHRKDASIVLVPRLLPSFAGLQLVNEVEHLEKALNPKHPFLFILGGAKAETKLPLLKKYLKIADTVFVGGVLANDFFKAEGFTVGKSKIDKNLKGLASVLKNKNLLLPAEVVVSRRGSHQTISLCDVQEKDIIVDVGVHAIGALEDFVKNAKLIIWNGPMGFYEGGNTKGTETLLKLLAKAKGMTIIGGGDTSVLVQKKKLEKDFTFVSTGGGATLDFLTQGTLPGIKSLK